MRVPAAFLALPLLAGSVAGILLVDHAPPHLIFATAAASAFAAVAAAGFFALEEAFAWGVLPAVILGAVLAGYSSGASTVGRLYAPSVLAWFDAQGSLADPVTVEGTLREDGASGAGGTLLTVGVQRVCIAEADCRSVVGGVRLSIGGAPSPEDVLDWRAGRRVRVPAMLRRPTSFANPGVPDEVRALARRSIALTGTVKSGALVEVTSEAGAVEEWAAETRAWTRHTLARLVGALDARSAAVATAILIGDRSGLPDDDERRLQDAGTYHVIAISGGNIAILTAVLIGIARLFRIPYRSAAVVTIGILLFYGEVAGGAASVERAIAAAVIFLSALILDHRGAPINVVAIAAILAVAAVPVAVLDAGFLLSFGATAGIILGVPRLMKARGEDGPPLLRRVEGVRRAAAGVLAATVCAEIALMPVAASLFSRVTVAGLALNFVAIPLMTAAQCGSLLLLTVAGVHAGLSEHLALLVHYAATGLVESARLVEWMPWVARDVLPPAWWLLATYYGAVVVALASASLRRASSLVLCLSACAVFAGRPLTSRGLVHPPPPDVLRVVVLDVGQADATVVLPPGGRPLLIDAAGLPGTSFDIGGRVLLPALRALRVRELHALVLTHGDPDHIGGADPILRRLAPRQVWEGVPVPPHPALRALAETAAGLGIPWRIVRPGDIDRVGKVEVRVHHPMEPDWERQRVRNDDSVVIELRYGDVSILLPGDIGREVEAALIPRLQLGSTVVLKAAHHGSATSSSDAFIDTVRPAAVIFSSGKNNRFNHPAPVVIERFGRRGIEAFNTAVDGAVFIETDGRFVAVHGWKTGRRLDSKHTKNTKPTKEGD